MSVTTKESFKLGKNALQIAFHNQTGSHAKCIAELVQNGIDALSSEVRVKITPTGFDVDDNGTGFQSAEAVHEYFKKVSFSHDTEIHSREGYVGAHGMGRLQAISMSNAAWRTNTFLMETNIQEKGLHFDFTENLPFEEGCKVYGDWFDSLKLTDLHNIVSELSQWFKYSNVDVFINGKLVNEAELKEPTLDNDHFQFWYKPDMSGLEIVNCGTYVKSDLSSPFSGIFISKKPLKLNTARNSILLSECPTWRIANRLLESWWSKQLVQELRESQYCSKRRSSYVMHLLSKGKLSPAQVMDAHFIQSLRKRPALTPNEIANQAVTVFVGYPEEVYERDIKGIEFAIDGGSLPDLSAYGSTIEQGETAFETFLALLNIDAKAEFIEIKHNHRERNSAPRTERKASYKVLEADKLQPRQRVFAGAFGTLAKGIYELMPAGLDRDVKMVRNLRLMHGECLRANNLFAVDADHFYVDSSLTFIGQQEIFTIGHLENILNGFIFLCLTDSEHCDGALKATSDELKQLYDFMAKNGKEIGELFLRVAKEIFDGFVANGASGTRLERYKADLALINDYRQTLEIYDHKVAQEK